MPARPMYRQLIRPHWCAYRYRPRHLLSLRRLAFRRSCVVSFCASCFCWWIVVGWFTTVRIPRLFTEGYIPECSATWRWLSIRRRRSRCLSAFPFHTAIGAGCSRSLVRVVAKRPHGVTMIAAGLLFI